MRSDRDLGDLLQHARRNITALIRLADQTSFFMEPDGASPSLAMLDAYGLAFGECLRAMDLHVRETVGDEAPR